jgi:hypothetical protein
MMAGGVHWMCVGCGLSGSPPIAGRERYANLRSESAAEWPRLGLEALGLEHFVQKLDPLTCISSSKFRVSS